MERILLAVQFLTRLPVKTGDINPGSLGRSTAFFPLVGVLLGLSLAGLAWLTARLFPPTVTMALVLVTLACLTGGMHFDGLIDTADGMFSGRSRKRILEIMRDSRVGAMGVLAAVFIVLLQYTCLVAIPKEKIYASLILMPAAGRWAMVCCIAAFPYAHPEGGLGKAFAEYTGKEQVLVATVTALVFAWGLLRFSGVAALLATGAAALLIAKRIAARIGGMTGDTYGAINTVGEAVFLLLLLGLGNLFWA